MQEIDFNSVANEFGIRKEDGVALAQRLKDFLGAQAIGWREHQKKMDLPKQDERYAIEFKRWRDYLGMVAPRDLPNHGVGQTFLVAWNCDGGSTSGGERTPMTIWLAKGKYLQVEAKTNQLAVVFYNVGELVHGTEEVQFNISGPLNGAIYIDSSVIITPTIATPAIF